MVKKNYPAAHSMDSYWFGIDKEGNLAVFDTGESGPIPNDASSNVDGFYHLMESIDKDNEGIGHFYFPDTSLDSYLYDKDLSILKERYNQEFIAASQIPLLSDKAIEFKSKEAFLSISKVSYVEQKYIGFNEFEKISKDFARVKLHKEREIYYLGRFKIGEILPLFETGEILGVIEDFTDNEFITKITQIYFYEDESEYTEGRGISKYRRVITPSNPRNVTLLPKGMQEQFQSTLPILFSEKEILQPLEYVKGRAMEDYYINENGEKIDYNHDD